MTSPTQRVNMQELIVALQSIKNNKNESPLSPELELLLKEGLHSAHLPDSLRGSAAENFQIAFELWGGVARLLLFADRYPGSFLKLYARQTAQTILPVIPPPAHTPTQDEWPEWMNAQRLVYRLGVASPDDDEDTP